MYCSLMPPLYKLSYHAGDAASAMAVVERDRRFGMTVGQRAAPAATRRMAAVLVAENAVRLAFTVKFATHSQHECVIVLDG